LLAKFEALFNLFLSFFFYYTSDIDRKRCRDLFFAQQKMKHRSDQYEKIFSAVLINI